MGKKQELITKHNIEFKDGNLTIEGNEIKFDNYSMMKIISNGANAIILKARGNISEDELVAIKIWVPDDKPDRKIQSQNEIKKFSQLNYISYTPNIIKYYGSGMINGYYYCVMEYLDTEKYTTLKEKLKNKMLLQERYQILMEIISGLRHSQENKIFHGDLHTENILVKKDDNSVKIIDYGTSFRNHEYSKQRDNIMTLDLGKKLLEEEFDGNLIFYYRCKPETLPQNVIRLIVKATAKIIVLLDFWKNGDIEAVVEDIALFASLVPFFNLRLLEKLLFETRKVPDRYKKNFEEKIITELFQKTIDMEFDKLESLYAEAQKRFIELCIENNKESYIYRDYHQATLFNGPLYAKHFGESEEAIERLEIEKVIE